VLETVEKLYKDIERDQVQGVEQTIIDYDKILSEDLRFRRTS